jgi:hypothetical protein
MASRSWRVEIPAPAPWLNANSRRDRRGQTPHRRAWRDAAHVHARAARLPKLGQAHITAVLHFRDRRRRDPHNFYPTIKAVVDGLVDYGMLDDDSAEYLVGPDIRLGEPVAVGMSPGRLTLTIRESGRG